MSARIYLSSPHMGEQERALLLDAFDSNWIAPLGPHVEGFERELSQKLRIAHAAVLSSGTAALHLALRILGVGPGDDVMVSTFTFAASATPIVYCGARPVFIDSDHETWNMDPHLLTEALEQAAARGKLPKAVVVVDLYGQCADYDPIVAACARFDVPLIEDAAEALGATYKGQMAGTFGRFGVISFNGNKIITTSGGGALVSSSGRDIEQARFLATQARDSAPHYQHSSLGFNYRMSNLLAAVGRGQLGNLDARVAARRANKAFYRAALSHVPGLTWMPDASFGMSNNWLSTCTIDAPAFGCHRETLRQSLDRANIEARPLWKPLHLQPVFAACPRQGGAVAEALFNDGLCLPSGSNMTQHDLQRVVDVVLATRNGDILG